MPDNEEIIPDFDPWDERDAYLEEGHDELEVPVVVEVEYHTGDEVNLDE